MLKIMNINRAFDVEKSLAQMVTKEGHGEAWAINHNLKEIRAAIEIWNAKLENFKAENYEKDCEGNDILFVVDMNSGEIIHADGLPIVYVQKKSLVRASYFEVTSLIEGQGVAKRLPEECISEIEDMFNEDLDLELEEIDRKILDSGKFDGIDLVPLVGFIIV